MVADIDFEGGNAVEQSEKMKSMLDEGALALWNSAEREQMLRTFPVSQDFLSSRTGGKVNGDSLGITGDGGEVNMDDFKYATLGVTLACSVLGVAALAFLPENIGATVCYLVAVIPVLFLGIGSSAPALIANVIANVKGTADNEEQRFDRICRHEAGHFMCGYLCGLPVKAYSVLDSGVPCVEFHPSQEGAALGRELKSTEIAALSVVAMSGSVAEILSFGNAKGGENDLLELDALFRRSEEFVGAQKQQDLTRWGALVAYQLLTNRMEKYQEVVEAFKEKRSIADCVAVIEG